MFSIPSRRKATMQQTTGVNHSHTDHNPSGTNVNQIIRN